MGEERESESESEVCRRGGGVVMDTPERTQIANPISKFEDSPVFNYINSLSPIKPVKSVHVTQTFNSLSFASLPSVFTSPHVSSLKESRFLKRHQFSDPAKPELSSENEKKAVGISKGIQDVARSSSEQEAFDLASSVAETSAGPPYERSKLDIELSRKLHYNCVSPGAQTVREMAGLSVSIVPVIQEDSGKGPFGSQVDIEGVNTVDHNKEVAGCDWESLISDAPDLLIFDSPSDVDPYKGSGQESLDPTKFSTKLTIDVPKTKVLDGEGSIQQHQEENLSENNGNLAEAAENQESLASSLNDCMLGGAMENVNDELGSNLHRGMRRRCLVFEMVGSRRKHLHDGLNSRPPMLSQSNEAIASNSNILVPVKVPNDSSRCILPGIGLHLNALATSSMDHKIVKHEGSASGGQLIIATPSTASYQSAQESLNMLPGGVSLERDIATAQNEAPVVEDASQEPGCMVNEELNHSSPKKKRRRLEQGGESEACKRCNCKKSKCLKLYCECFAAGVYCVEPCSCHDCFNKPIHEETVLSTRKQIESRNPLAFAPKVIRTSDPVLEIGDESSKTPASARHKRGCNCKKSGCLKKYCECYQGGVGCSINCRCEGCKNGFGRKDGSLVGPEDLEDEDVDESERSVVDKGLEKSVIQSEAEQNSATPATPSLLGRQPPQLPASSKSKPPRSFLAIGSTSGSFPKQRFGKLNPFQTQSKLEKHFQTVCEEDEIPEILQGNNSSPVRIGVKSASSPNSKRVSPPHSSSIKATVLSPGKQRSSRKLILQSIPSFPSLTPKH